MAVTPANVLDTLIETKVGSAVVLADAGGVRGARAVRAEGGVDEVLVVVSRIDDSGYSRQSANERGMRRQTDALALYPARNGGEVVLAPTQKTDVRTALLS